MSEEKNNGGNLIDGSPIKRRDFFRKIGTALAGASIAAVGVGGATKVKGNRKSDLYWQIDHEKCIQCGRCETSCVMPMSAVRCMHANKVCGYCDLCGGYYRTNAKELNTAAENMLCPTGAISRKFVEEPYFEYTIDEALCNGCGKCVKGCSSFGNGSLFLQIRQELCLNCNECNIAKVCPSGAISRVSYEEAYKFKDHA